MQSGETITSVEPTTSGVVRTVTSSGGTFYVECLRAGSYTLRVTTSKGRTADLPGTVVAPKLVLSQATLYANPDGTVAHTGTDGLTGNSLRVTYETTGAGGTPVGATFSVVTTDVAVGGKLHQSLFSELLEPQPSSTASILTFDVGSVNSSGITALDTYANDVYEYSGANGSSAPNLATVTVAPKVVSTGVDQKTFTVKKVNPFVGLSSTVQELPDEDDYGLVNTYNVYRTHSYSANSADVQYVHAMNDNTGAEVFLNGSIASGTLGDAFSTGVSTDSHSSSSHICRVTCGYTLSESALSAHKGGLVELKVYVENQHSGNRLRRTYATFGIYVHGAIGATLEISNGGKKATVGTDWCGTEASYGFGKVSGYKFIHTDYENDQAIMLSGFSQVTISDKKPSDSEFGETVYSMNTESGTFTEYIVTHAEKPRFEFLSVTGIGVFVAGDGLTTGYYYLQPSGTPSVNGHGYYVLHNLGDIQNKADLMGAKQGWLLN